MRQREASRESQAAGMNLLDLEKHRVGRSPEAVEKFKAGMVRQRQMSEKINAIIDVVDEHYKGKVDLAYAAPIALDSMAIITQGVNKGLRGMVVSISQKDFGDYFDIDHGNGKITSSISRSGLIPIPSARESAKD